MASGGAPVVQQVRVVNFDGCQFLHADFMGNLPLFEMTYRARRGDESAAAALNAAGIQAKDVRGKQYWPMVTEAAAVEPDLAPVDEPQPQPTAVEPSTILLPD